jgi:hypothetical protein
MMLTLLCLAGGRRFSPPSPSPCSSLICILILSCPYRFGVSEGLVIFQNLIESGLGH